MRAISTLLIFIIIPIVLSGCGGGGGGNEQASNGVQFNQTYVTSGLAGEVMTYSFNTADTGNRQYTNSVTYSAYGLGTSPDSGTLSPNANGSFSAQLASPRTTSATVLAVQNRYITGSVNLPFVKNRAAVSRDTPFIGFANPSQSDIFLGNTQNSPIYYNFIAVRCTSKSYGVIGPSSGCASTIGTLKLETISIGYPDYLFCEGSNLASGACAQSTRQGKLSHVGNGIWQFLDSNNNAINVYLMLSQAQNGQKVGVIDFGEAGGFGFGTAILTEQQSADASTPAGTYFFVDTSASTGFLTIDSSGSFNGSALVANAPWTGFLRHGPPTVNDIANENYVLASGSGVLAYRDRSSSAFAFKMGIRKTN